MPSHAYFHAHPHASDWKADDPEERTAAGARFRDEVADAVLAALPDFRRNDPADHDPVEHPWVSVYGRRLEITVFQTFVHVRLPWFGHAECREHRVVETLHELHRVLGATAGFTMFEHGCQGLDVEGDIDAVPDALAGTTHRINEVLSRV